MDLSEIKEKLQKDWADEAILDLCLRIVDFVAVTPVEQTKFLTFTTFKTALGRVQVDGELLRALTVLVSSRVHVLEAGALLIDDDDSEHELTSQDLAAARQTGELIHPETGEPVPDFEHKVIPFFTPSAQFLDARNG